MTADLLLGLRAEINPRNCVARAIVLVGPGNEGVYVFRLMVPPDVREAYFGNFLVRANEAHWFTWHFGAPDFCLWGTKFEVFAVARNGKSLPFIGALKAQREAPNLPPFFR